MASSSRKDRRGSDSLILQKEGISQTVTFRVVNGAWNDGSIADIVVTLIGQEGDTLKLAKEQIPAAGSKPDDTYKAGSWDVEPDTKTAITADTVYTYTYEPVISYTTVYGNGQKWWKGRVIFRWRMWLLSRVVVAGPRQ